MSETSHDVTIGAAGREVAAPRGPGRDKVILTTFAGRRDRMELLVRHARRTLDAGIVDEWHV